MLSLQATALCAQNPGSPVTEPLTAVERGALVKMEEDSAVHYRLADAWYRGQRIQYYDFGLADLQPSALYRVRDGDDVISTLPGLPGYSALRLVYDVRVTTGIDPTTLRSHEDVLKLVGRGAARLAVTGAVLNAPVVAAGSTLEDDPLRRPLRSAWYKGRRVFYFDLGAARAVTMPAAVVTARAGSDRGPGTPGSAQALHVGSVPGAPGYSDFWEIVVAVAERPADPERYHDARQVWADARSGRPGLRPQGVVRDRPVIYVDGRPAARGAKLLAGARAGGGGPESVARAGGMGSSSLVIQTQRADGRRGSAPADRGRR